MWFIFLYKFIQTHVVDFFFFFAMIIILDCVHVYGAVFYVKIVHMRHYINIYIYVCACMCTCINTTQVWKYPELV